MIPITRPLAADKTPPGFLPASARSLWRHRQLIVRMTRRDVIGRYKGSVMGLAWSFFNPLLMLSVYTFVFSVVFKARWGQGADGNKMQFAVVLFVGMVIHGLFAEVLNRSPGLILGNANYVKKIIFPLEILPVVCTGGALFHGLISLAVLLAAHLLFYGYLHWTIVFLPLILAPFMVLVLGLSWFLASLGVFVRDVGQTTGLLTTVLAFLAPVFYPVTALPEGLRPWLMLNPLTFAIEQARAVIVWGQLPDWSGLGLYVLVASAVAILGHAWFQRTRKGFSDVI